MAKDVVLSSNIMFDNWICFKLFGQFSCKLIHDVNHSQLSGASHRSSEKREALLDARRDTVTHRSTRLSVISPSFVKI